MRTFPGLRLTALAVLALASPAWSTPPELLGLPESVPARAEIDPYSVGFPNAADAPVLCPLHAPKRTAARTMADVLPGFRDRLPQGTERGDVPPRPASVPPAEYPAQDWLAGIEGHVQVALLIDDAGRVLASETLCSTNERFELEALKAVAAAHYLPGMRHGRRVAGIAIQPFEFALE